MKGSKERYLLGQKHNLQILAVIPFVGRHLITRHCHANILPSTGQENNIAQPKMIRYFALHLNFRRFSPFNCCFSVVL